MTLFNNADEVLSAISNATNVDEIITILDDAGASNIVLEADDLKNIALAQSTTLSGNDPVLLYSGTIDQVKTIDIAQNFEGVKIINQTNAAKLADSDAFREALLDSFEGDLAARDNFLFSKDTGNGTVGLWHELSESFINDNASGDVRTITPFTNADSVFAQTEIPALLDNPNVTSINGLDKADLPIGNEVKVIQQHSAMHFATLDKDVIGGNLSGSQLLNLDTRFSELMDDIASTKLFSKATLTKIGLAGDVIGVVYALYDANEAYASGDTDSAAQIMSEWAAGFAGSIAGGTAAAIIMAELTAPLLTVGVPGAVTAAVLTFSAGIAGAIGGEEVGLKILEIGQDFGLVVDEASVQYDEMIDAFLDQVEAQFGQAGIDFFAGNFAGATPEILQQAAQAIEDKFGDVIFAITEALLSAYDFFKRAEEAFRRPLGDPLVLDLDGDGIELVSIENSTVNFDIDEDGAAEAIGWVAPDDGFLAYDQNGNGTIDGYYRIAA